MKFYKKNSKTGFVTTLTTDMVIRYAERLSGDGNSTFDDCIHACYYINDSGCGNTIHLEKPNTSINIVDVKAKYTKDLMVDLFAYFLNDEEPEKVASICRETGKVFIDDVYSDNVEIHLAAENIKKDLILISVVAIQMAHIAGYREHPCITSREAINKFREWAIGFSDQHRYTDWEKLDYMDALEAYLDRVCPAESEFTIRNHEDTGEPVVVDQDDIPILTIASEYYNLKNITYQAANLILSAIIRK